VKEACGVFGVYAPGRNVAQLTFDGLYALQHRGQESAGMAVSDGVSTIVVRDMGLVTTVFDERTLSGLVGHLAIGHTRYSTAGSSSWGNAQPVYRDMGRAGFALGHNGNLTDTDQLARRAGTLPGMASSDSDVMADLVAQAAGRLGEGGGPPDLRPALRSVLPQLDGAFSLVVSDDHHLYGVRDPHGFRPLALGRLGPAAAPEGWVLASETPALDVVGASFVRELRPGELVMIDASGVHAESFLPAGAEEAPERLCIFEFVYFARPDSRLFDQEVHSARRRMGELLADEAPVEADMVMGVPDSGVPAAEGYAQRSGIPYGHGLVKNRYIGRTFIDPDQSARASRVRRKFNPLKDSIAGKRLVVVDDTIVRGTTQRAVVQMLRDAGAEEVHLRIPSPPLRWPCFFGIDIPTREELLAARMSVEDIARFLEVDSLAYLSLGQLKAAIGVKDRFCDACLTGRYPAPVPEGARAGLERAEAVLVRRPSPEGPRGTAASDEVGVDLAEPALQGSFPGM
jgi:amidophosphoribosyltransferase